MHHGLSIGSPDRGLDRGSMTSASGLGLSHTKMIQTLTPPNHGARERTFGISLAAFLTIFRIGMMLLVIYGQAVGSKGMKLMNKCINE